MRYCCTQCGATNIRMKKRRENKLGCIIMLLAPELVIVGALIFSGLCGFVVAVLQDLTPESMKGIWSKDLVGFVLLVALILSPYVFYRLFAKTTIVCRKCKGENCLVPMKSPRGQEILYGGVGQNGGGNPRLVQAKKIIIKKKIVFKKPVVNVDKEK